jgi:Ser/Thr protein kinase RdoA (MazF antagonist)
METAHEVGVGLARYLDLTSAIDPQSIATALPGYRDTTLYFNQLDSALEGCRSLFETAHRLPEDDEVRQASARHFLCVLTEDERLSRRSDSELSPFIDLALRSRDLGMCLHEARERGEIRRTAIHGDTKIENFLFDAMTGKVVALVDLDTVMPLTWLADWGDMVRSLCNVAGEKERDLSKVEVDREVYASVLEGFLSTAATATEAEIALMPRAVQAIALELGVRFLADYLRGDTYFQLGPGDPPDLNKVRAMVQLRLFERLLEHEPEARALIDRFSRVVA